MRKQWKGFLAGFLAAMLLGTVATPALGALAGKTIQVFTGVNVYVDDQLVQPKDANGNPVEVFVYNGTTYLPIRAIGNALGMPVQWEGKTNSVYISSTSTNFPSRFEGPGYTSAQDAATAYLNALQKGDLADAFSTFAIESHVENTNCEEFLKTYGWSLDSPTILTDSDYEKQIVVYSRLSAIASSLYAQGFAYNGYVPLPMAPFADDESELRFFLNASRKTDFTKAASSAKFVEFLPVTSLLDPDELEPYKNDIERNKRILGCNAYQDTALHVKFGGEDYILIIGSVKYNGKWYNSNHPVVTQYFRGKAATGLFPYNK